ncbi:ead/Ea22-like family protein [Burkholderia contaminans]|uniref:Uncharacterized protein n=1 Tax=Burkholderia contaminans TaxID=488447 RepID=A0A3N8RND6_9BURK|nr:ead/Ea22-like family protein [Burkholderia contaminans]RQT33456.1 hypothetical protein DF037_07680 [Burkholderia contaminans]
MEHITNNYDALQAAAEKATKGNWINVGAWVENEHDDLKDICDCRPNGNEDYEQALLDATYIALANPDTVLRLLRERRTAIEAATSHPTHASVAAIQYALDAEEGFEWLSLWNEGEFERCRRDWPDAPDDCYIGADPMHPETPRMLAAHATHLPAASSVDLRSELRRILDLLDTELGDSDPMIEGMTQDEIEEECPVFAAMQIVAALYQKTPGTNATARTYPNELSAALRHVLGIPNFRCAPIAQLMRDSGAKIKMRSESEQAHVLHWLVKLVLDHGEGWAGVAENELDAMRTNRDAAQLAEVAR